jgi:signal peptidase I
MLPTLSPGDHVLAVSTGRVRRGEVWVFRHGDALLVKRLVGAPGDGLVAGSGAMVVGSAGPVDRPGPQPDGSWVLGPDEYLLQGDNHAASADLRAFGPVSADRLLGRVVFRYWPRPGRVR